MMFSRTMFGLAAIALLTLLPACSDDGVSPESIKVVVKVVDPLGEPVSGLDMAVVPDTPFYQDEKASDAKPAVKIPFRVAQDSDVRLVIEDIEGTEVRFLGEETVAPGTYEWIWDGRGDDALHLYSGVYTVNLVIRHAGTDVVVLDQDRDMLMALIDPARLSVGTTDADGRIELDDRRLFPHLFDPPDIPATDGSGELAGTIHLTSTMRFYLADQVLGGLMRFDRDVAGSTTLEFVWDVMEAVTSNGDTRVESGPDAKDDPLPNELGRPFPCPFN